MDFITFTYLEKLMLIIIVTLLIVMNLEFLVLKAFYSGMRTAVDFNKRLLEYSHRVDASHQILVNSFEKNTDDLIYLTTLLKEKIKKPSEKSDA